MNHAFDFLETIRMHTPVPVLRRECTKDWTVPETNVIIPAGTVALIPIQAIHNDPKYYPQPEQFQPERFQQSKPFLEQPYLPFGDGPRNCIGIRLGKMTTKIGLILTLRAYTFELCGNTIQKPRTNPKSFLLAPIGGLDLKVSKRQNVKLLK